MLASPLSEASLPRKAAGRVAVAIVVVSAAASVALAAVVLHLLHGVALPDGAAVQAAYDREAAASGALHDKDLRIVSADCGAVTLAKVRCQVAFTSRAAGPFLDSADLEARGQEWKLVRGLCRGVRPN